jgi:hypothetical protein
MGFFNDAAMVIGKGLAQTAVQAASDETGYDIGGTLNFLFGDGQEVGGADMALLATELDNEFSGTPEQLAYLQDSITQQQSQLVNMGQELASISLSVKQIRLAIARIEEMLEKIHQHQLYQAWITVDTQIELYATGITVSYDMYVDYVSRYDQVPVSEINLLKTDILSGNNGPVVGLAGINNLILDEGQRKGALQLWSNMVAELVADGQISYRDAINQYFDYYRQLTFAQLTATNLVMEAYNLNGDTQASTNFYEKYRAYMKSQESTFITWMMPIINSAVEGNYWKSESGYSNFGVEAGYALEEINPNFYTLKDGAQYYSPSSSFREAEELLSALYDSSSEDRRIVVYMTYATLLADQLPSLPNVPLTLTSIDQASVIQPTFSDELGSPYNFLPSNMAYVGLPDTNLTSMGSNLSVKRYVFSNPKLGDGQFKLTSLNGKDNLVPYSTYASTRPGASGTANFQTEATLDFVLGVNQAGKFDFMNFLAYNYPYTATT